ncbi:MULTISPECIES: acyl-CoA thioesterase [Amycolatopsis]|uniref:Acyl-CoA thioesterase n=1 Tax=Amycolatopsis thermalba TaxID=944492 RepID=A0ABY4NTF0_9PSEU|nr:MULTISPECIES: thioesterase family protein [Amycolatopsis]OXM65596.1 thioesterase [Amycolatopsis sp. KNN50.9b]UQS23330.1 acyl-CoA thioesterase [Amycolatopsis thermalba]
MYVAKVRPRWSDMDVFGHVNHANMVTLLEEARVPLLFDEAGRAGLAEFAKGMVVVKLAVHYRAPIVVDGQEIRVEISLKDLKFASLTLDYRVHDGPDAGSPVAVTAETVLAPYDVTTSRPRRLTAEERAFLQTRLTEAGA